MTPSDQDEEDKKTGLPGFRTWRAVYGFVFLTFALWVVLLTAFTRCYR